MEIISDLYSLQQLCKKIEDSEYLAIDTEFLRDKTYYPKLCLIQIANDKIEAIIDPIEDLDLTPFWNVIKNNSMIKVFHAGRQDIEIFNNEGGFLPKPIFDTQIAAMFCGYGESISYGNLVYDITSIQLDKTSQFTDWSKRPLSEKQLTYALNDAIYLKDVYKSMIRKLEHLGRIEWIDEEMDNLLNPKNYEYNSKDAWLKIKSKPKSIKSLKVLADIAEWREKKAQIKNIPKNRIIRDNTIIDIANHMPKNQLELKNLRSFSKNPLPIDTIDEIVAVVNALETDKDRREFFIDKKKELTKDQEGIYEVLKLVLKIQSKKFNIVQRLIATSEDLENIAKSKKSSIAMLDGWRYEIFGEIAKKIKNGDISISVKNGTVSLS
ncbi:MAG: ribonuclease D [Alphaproteobacteria bacterium]|jgi:ribonuclease D